ncbi:MAG: mechanosensitive ion channel [Acidimicrobiales bacterium]
MRFASTIATSAAPGSLPRLSLIFAQEETPVDALPSPDTFVEWSIGAAVLLTGFLVLHKLVSLIVRSTLRQPSMSRTVLVRTRAPIRVILIGSVLIWWVRHSSLQPETDASVIHASRIVVICGFGFLFVRLLGVVADGLVMKLPLDEADNLRSRRAQTQVSVLRRVGTVGIVVLTSGVVMWTFPEIRALGTSILASAGLIGVLAGVAARSTFGNLVAGLQIAFAEPIRLDDVVVVEGEYGTVEEITLTYVVVRAWDMRRLVIPSAYFVENRFENWTKTTSELIGSAHFHLDLTADVAAFRAEALRFISVRPEWNGDVAACHVVDTDLHALRVRVLASATDSALTFELRAAIREHMLHWLRENRPHDLPKVRGQLVDPDPRGTEG